MTTEEQPSTPSASAQWYVIHTYSGYEEKVAESIRQRAESLDMFVSVKDTENMSKPSKSEKRGRCTRTIVAR